VTTRNTPGWRLGNCEWSFDALSRRQEVGDRTPGTSAERMKRLRDALLGEVDGG
jgi:hypothetical protein